MKTGGKGYTPRQMMRTGLVVVVLFTVASAISFGQYGQILHAAAGQDMLSVGESIRLVGVASGSLRPEIGADEARSTLRKLGVRLPAGADDSPVTYGGFAFLLTQLFDLRGSITYGIFPGPGSAFDEMRARGFVGPRTRAGQPLSGPDGLLILRRVMAARGAVP